jgi:predicted metalloprotease
MRWQGGERGGNVEDRRGMGRGVVAGGGIGAAAIAAALYLFFGVPPQVTQKVLGGSSFGGVGAQQEGKKGSPEDQAGQFVDVIGTNINRVWEAKMGGRYTPPVTVLYEEATQTACGAGQAGMGPFYCPTDQKVYLDLSFWKEMETKLGASGADFARAYVIAHEFGHHVQTLTGASQKVQQAQRAARSEGDANRYSVALELQADCYAGVWAANAEKASKGEPIRIDPNDLAEGMKTANAIGDDTLMRNAGRNASPEKFTHGSSEQRMRWLKQGYETGNPAVCDGTFEGL